jgi:hypothetical protein
MPIPTLSNAQIDTDSPLDEAVMKTGLRDRDEWLWSTATAAGIDPNVLAFVAQMLSHGHTGAAGDGAQIPTAGIAANAVNDSAMIGANAVTAGKIASNTMDTADIANGACTEPKLHGTQGEHLTSSSTFNVGDPPGAGDDSFKGDRKTISHSKGTIGVVTSLIVGNISGADIPYWIVEVTASDVTFGLWDTGSMPSGDNTWVIDCYIM